MKSVFLGALLVGLLASIGCSNPSKATATADLIKQYGSEVKVIKVSDPRPSGWVSVIVEWPNGFGQKIWIQTVTSSPVPYPQVGEFWKVKLRHDGEDGLLLVQKRHEAPTDR